MNLKLLLQYLNKTCIARKLHCKIQSAVNSAKLSNKDFENSIC